MFPFYLVKQMLFSCGLCKLEELEGSSFFAYCLPSILHHWYTQHSSVSPRHDDPRLPPQNTSLPPQTPSQFPAPLPLRSPAHSPSWSLLRAPCQCPSPDAPEPPSCPVAVTLWSPSSSPPRASLRLHIVMAPRDPLSRPRVASRAPVSVPILTPTLNPFDSHS